MRTVIERLCLIYLVLSLSSFSMITRDGTTKVILNVPTGGGSHVDTGIVPADMPDVYYDSGEGSLTIIGYGEVAYYDIVVTDGGTTVFISDTVNGTSDTVDVSGLATGTYTLVCTTPAGHTYTGQFTVSY